MEPQKGPCLQPVSASGVRSAGVSARGCAVSVRARGVTASNPVTLSAAIGGATAGVADAGGSGMAAGTGASGRAVCVSGVAAPAGHPRRVRVGAAWRGWRRGTIRADASADCGGAAASGPDVALGSSRHPQKSRLRRCVNPERFDFVRHHGQRRVRVCDRTLVVISCQAVRRERNLALHKRRDPVISVISVRSGPARHGPTKNIIRRASRLPPHATATPRVPDTC